MHRAYIVAVSGGIDSVSLLHMIASNQWPEEVPPSDQLQGDIMVAHFDHGIRADSARDETFVRDLAEKYGLAYESKAANLGPDCSEAAARQARYTFLDQIAQQSGGQIVTAHHLDDRIETAILNLQRGTGRRGLSSLRSTKLRIRPLIGVSKQTITTYAKQYNLSWREDSTNQDIRYKRNQIRLQTIPVLDRRFPGWRNDFIAYIDRAEQLNAQIETLLADYMLSYGSGTYNRERLQRLDAAVLTEVIAWIIRQTPAPLSQKTLGRAVDFIRTAPGKKRLELGRGVELRTHQKLILVYQ